MTVLRALLVASGAVAWLVMFGTVWAWLDGKVKTRRLRRQQRRYVDAEYQQLCAFYQGR